jgi:hypothetical protein
MVDRILPDRMKELLVHFAERSPTIQAELLEEDIPDASGDIHHTPPTTESPDWCICGNCRKMPKPSENKCCGKMPDLCLSQVPGMEIAVLDPQVLRVSMDHRNDLLAEDNLANDSPTADVHRPYRHAAYRQWVLMRHRKLGAGDRRIIPSCCVIRIRGVYPDPDNVYTGFIASRI